MEFVDRVSAYPNRYILTDENGNASFVVLERADEPTTPGTPLNAETFNAMQEAAASAAALEKAFASGATVLSKHQYGSELPTTELVPGRIFFKVVG